MTGPFAEGTYSLNGKRHLVSCYFPSGKETWLIQPAPDPRMPGLTSKELTPKVWAELKLMEE